MVRNLGTYEEGWTGKDGVTINFQTGCEGGCLFCFARLMADEYGWCPWDQWTSPVIRTKDVAKGYRKRKGRIMLPSSHNIDGSNLVEATWVLMKLLDAGNENILVVMKTHPDVMGAICLSLKEAGYIDRVEIRHSIPTLHYETWKLFMPGCPTADEIFEAIRRGKKYHVKQSVNIGPFVCRRPWEVVQKAVKFGITPDNIWIEPMSHRTKLYKRSAVLRKYKDKLERLYSPRSLRAIHDQIELMGYHINYKKTFTGKMAKEPSLKWVLANKKYEPPKCIDGTDNHRANEMRDHKRGTRWDYCKRCGATLSKHTAMTD
ncbi:MAG: radical SAM protein [Candidatus Odinarchaeota archaeon]